MPADTPHDTTSVVTGVTNGLAPPLDPPWKPIYLFVYGSLMDTDVIQYVLRLPNRPPPLQPAKLKNYKMMMWGIYPTLIPSDYHISSNNGGDENEGSPDDSIPGALYLVEDPAKFSMLERYETRAYTWCRCVAEFTADDGSTLTTEQSGFECRTFVWAGDPYSLDLFGGTFDLERYRKYYKPKFLTNRLS
ncbi:hypothetical protein ACJ72_01656 [Emergomyces africanus]|uniref:Putative gamma-glutamylcyclotransferase n=1 Tax=Emergomyces africanus TaxID=1955775 RepID=A0A1B7P4L7_9EURO|nr:hypothetical protein ACJ72_01656 [Emergomyces africanus]